MRALFLSLALAGLFPVRALVGVALVVAAAWFGLKYAEHPTYGEIATMAFYDVWLYGVFVIGVLAVVFGWVKRAWDRTALPPA